jgi:serine/threonine protein kinase
MLDLESDQMIDIILFLIDFGLAKSMDESGGLKTFCGTPQYFAPEVN